MVEFIGVAKAAQEAGVSHKTVYRWIEAKKVVAIKILREWAVDPGSLPRRSGDSR